MKIKLNNGITKYQEKQCELFSNYSVSSSLSEYKKRNQLDKDKIISDIYNGKIAEFLVYNFLISKGKILNSPDLNIYSGYKKSFDADLILDNVNIHVKSHIINGIFPVSWVFQRTDPLVKSPSDKDYLALVVLDDRGSYMYLKKTSQVLFKDPVKDVLKRTKVCVYETDIN